MLDWRLCQICLPFEIKLLLLLLIIISSTIIIIIKLRNAKQ